MKNEGDIEKKNPIIKENPLVIEKMTAEDIQALQEHKERYRAILENIVDGYYEVDLAGKLTFFNDSLCRMTGYGKDELMGMSNLEYMEEETARRVYQAFNGVYETGNPVENLEYQIIIQRGRSRRDVETSISLKRDAAGRATGFRGILRDITDRKRAAQAVRESEERYRELFERGSDLLCFHDLEGGLIDTNLAFKKQYGWDADDFAHMNLRDLIPERYRHEFEDYLKRVQENGQDEGLMRVTDKNGREFIIEYNNSLVYDAKGAPTGVRGSARDITERIQAEKALQKSEERYRELVEDINDVLFTTDETGVITYISPGIESILGYSASEGVGHSFAEFVHPDDLPGLVKRFEEVLSGNLEPTEYRLLTKSGEPRWVRTSSRPAVNAGRVVGLRGLLVDITESKRLQAQLQETQKMEAIATLAGGIAHQFNNALSSITGYTELLEMDYPQDEKITGYTENMKQSAHRMAHLTDQLLAYARGGKYNPEILSLNSSVKDTIALLKHTHDPLVNVETDLPLDVMKIEADSTQIEMALSAIVANSNEAMEGPGRIRISTRNMDLDQEFIKDHQGLKPGPHVCLSIEDDGTGMDEETRDRIFDPFFTTHFIGRGLGMASVYGVIKNHDGSVIVESELGKGTVVRIYLPAIEAKGEVKEEVVLGPTVELAMGEGTVLVIEDEEVLVEMFRQILERLGYRVLQAVTGKQAVEFTKTFDGQIDLALLDIKLPDMEGNKIYPLIMEARPDLKVIVCSGYSIGGPAQDILDAGAEGFIQKPFSISAFADKLKEVLEEK